MGQVVQQIGLGVVDLHDLAPAEIAVFGQVGADAEIVVVGQEAHAAQIVSHPIPILITEQPTVGVRNPGQTGVVFTTVGIIVLDTW